jgi:hypothetical protein
MWVCGLDGAGLGEGQVACACECGDDPSGSIKCGEPVGSQEGLCSMEYLSME